jgi:hypothetical protein
LSKVDLDIPSASARLLTLLFWDIRNSFLYGCWVTLLFVNVRLEFH